MAPVCNLFIGSEPELISCLNPIVAGGHDEGGAGTYGGV